MKSKIIFTCAVFLFMAQAAAAQMYGNIVLKPGGGGWNPENPQPYDTSVILGISALSLDGHNGTIVADYEAGTLRIGCDGGDMRVWVTVVNRLSGMVYRECVDCTAGVWTEIDASGWPSGFYTLIIVESEERSWRGDFHVE